MTVPPNADLPSPGPAKSGRRGRLANRVRWIGSFALFVVLVPLVALLFRDRIATSFLPGILGDALGLRVSIDAVSISLRGSVIVRGFTGDAPDGDSALRALRVGELRGSVSLLDLRSKGLLEAIESIAATDVAVEIDLDGGGGGNGAPSDGSGGFAWPEKPPEIAVRGDVVLLSRDARLELRDLDLRATPAGLLEATAAAAWRLGDRTGAAPAALRVAYSAGTFSGAILEYGGETLLDAARFDVATLSGEATLRVAGGLARVEVSDAATGVLRAAVSARGVLLEDALSLALRTESIVSGSADLEAIASVPLADPLAFCAEVSAEVRDGAVAGVPVDRADVVAWVDRGFAVVSRFHATGQGGQLDVRDLRVPLDGGFDPPSLLASASGRVSLSVEDATRAARLVFEPGELRAAFTGASIDAEFAFESGAVTILSLQAASERLAALVSIDAATVEPDLESPRESRFFGTGRVSVGNVSSFSRFLPPGGDPSGALDVEFAASGTLASPSVRAAIRGRELGAFGVAGVALDAVAFATLDSVHVPRLDAASPEGTASLAFAASWGGDDAEPHLAFAEVDARVSSLRERSSLPITSGRLRARATGPLSWPDVSATVEADGFGTATIEKAGDGIVARVTRLTTLGLILDVDAEGSVARDLSSGEIAISRFRALADGEAWEQEGVSLISFDVARRRFLVDPALAVRSGAESILLSLSARDGLLEGNASVRLSGEGAVADLLRRAVPEADVSFTLLRFDAAASAPFSALDGSEDGWVLPESIRATLSVDRIAAHGASGSVDAILRVAAPPGGGIRSATFDAAFGDLRSSLVAGNGVLPGHASVNVAWDGETVTVVGGAIDWAGLVASLSGSARFTSEGASALLSGEETSEPDDLDLRLDGRVDELSALRAFAPEFRRMSGSSVIALRIAGSAVEPLVSGTVDVADLDTRIGDLPPLVGVKGRLVLEGDSVVVEQVAGEMGGSPFTVEGGVTSLSREPRLDFRLEGEDLLLVREDDARIRGTARIAVQGPLAKLAISGELTLTDARVRRDVAILDVGGLLRKSVRRVRSVAARPSVGAAGGIRLFSIHEPPLRDATFDVIVSAEEPIELLGNVFSGKLRPDVRLQGSGQVPFLTGVVYVEDFLLKLPASRIRVESGILRFDEMNPFYPEIEMTGSTRMRGYDIDVSISGPYNDPLLVLSSNPPMPSDQLMVLVATGRTPADEASRTDTAVLIGVASYLGGDLLTSLFGGGGVDDDGESILDRFELDVGRNVSRAGQETIEARFRLKRGVLGTDDTLYLTGERDEFEHYNAGLRIVFRGN